MCGKGCAGAGKHGGQDNTTRHDGIEDFIASVVLRVAEVLRLPLEYAESLIVRRYQVLRAYRYFRLGYPLPEYSSLS